MQEYPTFMEFFTTRDRLEIADVPFTIAEDKPTRRQALSYYRAVVDRYKVPLALYEDVLQVRKEGDGFSVRTEKRTSPPERRPRSGGPGPWRWPPATSAGRATRRARRGPPLWAATRRPTPSSRTW